MIPNHFRFDAQPTANPDAVVTSGEARFTLLTSRLIRMEYAAAEDRPSQAFWFRQQPVPPFEIAREDGVLNIKTEHLHLRYTEGSPFTAETLSITLLASGKTWRLGDADPLNLKGTTRTLDRVDGETALEQGLISRSGWAFVDDSASLVFTPDGWLTARSAPDGALDLYFFGYGTDYSACLADFRRIAGQVPLIPRWALGNWWSRYHEYTQDELKTLVKDFKRRDIPLSVCIIDMDWHITATGNRCSGWTGFTWNRELFPDPWKLVRWMHKQGLKVSLNIHPAEGIHPHEEQYADMAKALGIVPETEKPVAFDIADPAFTDAYFRHIFHPYEAQGIDFWWMDWQQGEMSSLPGLDPLWWLNHLHFLDLMREGDRRPFIFSRWGGLGNHRYPIGFSGDTVVSWESLAFQPGFTSAASNVGYGWWSHDIGGHYQGQEDAELYLRWVQYGVFSPILRLHATKGPFYERMPWSFDRETEHLAKQAMQLRHALIPYIYTMAWRDHSQHVPLVRPLYHVYPDKAEAYMLDGQYFFGSELIAAPYTTPQDAGTRMSRKTVWLPEGDWFDFSSGEHYGGDAWYALHGMPGDIPVFAKAGAVVPMASQAGWGSIENPDALEIVVFPGADNQFELYEDDGDSLAYRDGAHALTPMTVDWSGNEMTFTIHPARGDLSVLPGKRRITVHFRGVAAPEAVSISAGGDAIATHYDEATDTLIVGPINHHPDETAIFTLSTGDDALISARDRRAQKVEAMLRRFAMPTDAKSHMFYERAHILDDPGRLARFRANAGDAHLHALLEVIAGVGVEQIGDRIAVWNNRELPGARYRFSKALGWIGYDFSDKPLPRARIFTPDDDPRHPRPWRLEVDFFGVVQAVIASR